MPLETSRRLCAKKAVIVSIWKGAWVHKLNTMALIVETLHVANAFNFINVLPIHVFVPSEDGCFCARRMTARQAFVPAYRTHIVGFACYFGRACVQISAVEFHHFGCGCVFFFFEKKTIECGRHVCESHSLEGSSDLFCCTARMTNDVQTIIAGTSHHDMVYF